MFDTLVLAITVLLTAVFGLRYKSKQGQVKLHFKDQYDLSNLGINFEKNQTFLLFTSDYCSPCQATKTILNEFVEGSPTSALTTIRAEDHFELCKKLGIFSTPTTLIINNQAKEIGRIVGTPRKEMILNDFSI